MNNQDEMNTPETLAELLDRILPPNQNEILVPSSTEQSKDDDRVLTAIRLSAAPKLTLSPEAFARIEAQIRTTPIKQKQLPFRIGLAAAGIILVMLIILLTSQGEDNNPDQNVARLVSATPSEVEGVTPTVTIELTITSTVSDTPSQTATRIPTDTPVIVTPSATNTVFPSDTPLRNTATPTVAIMVSATPLEQITVQPIEIIIEGAIEKIDKNTLTIYGFHIQLVADDPLLKVLRVDDVVRIEGNVEGSGENLLVYALKLELQNTDEALNEVYIQGDTNEVWRDDGTCTNRPPDWAAANGWRKRCEQPSSPPQGDNNNQGSRNNNNGMGNNDDDDD